MLVLTRKTREKVIIGCGPKAVVVTIVRVNGEAVRLGFEAPRDVPIIRSELAEGQ